MLDTDSIYFGLANKDFNESISLNLFGICKHFSLHDLKN